MYRGTAQLSGISTVPQPAALGIFLFWPAAHSLPDYGSEVLFFIQTQITSIVHTRVPGIGEQRRWNRFMAMSSREQNTTSSLNIVELSVVETVA
jgi:hypothetical protein